MRLPCAAGCPCSLRIRFVSTTLAARNFCCPNSAGGNWTADLLFARGELYRMRGNPRDLVNAADFYRQSIALDASRAEAYRGLGLSLMRSRLADEARPILTQYLTMRPDAADAALIRAMLVQS